MAKISSDTILQLSSIAREKAVELHSAADLQSLDPLVADARIVMLGEATHGTHEFYTWRSAITKRLITEYNFNFIAVEGDWPDCYHINRFVKGYSGAASNAVEVVSNFKRWPTWMWCNWEVVALSEWLHQQNLSRSPENRVGFYGLDVYSLWESIESISNFLEKHHPEEAQLAKDAYQCFEPYRYDGGASYGRANRLVSGECEDEVLRLLQKMPGKWQVYSDDPEASFNSIQNAHVAINAEKYFRVMMVAGSASWNVRDEHMMDTLNRLLEYHGPQAKAVIWEHNTHIGDARATSMKSEGMFNIGQLAKEEFGDEVVLIGFGTGAGEVLAGNSWGAPVAKMKIPPGRKGSWEAVLHETDLKRFLLLPDALTDISETVPTIDHRAIGVVYNPQMDSYWNYVASNIGRRYDAFIYIDRTSALHAISGKAEDHSVPDTYPFGL